MKTKIKPEQDFYVIELSGYIDFETAKPISESFEEIYRRDENAKIVVDMRHLEFVGSSGISDFVKTLRVYNKMRMKPAYFGVKTEFQRLFKIFESDSTFDVVEKEGDAKKVALERFQVWQARTQRSKMSH